MIASAFARVSTPCSTKALIRLMVESRSLRNSSASSAKLGLAAADKSRARIAQRQRVFIRKGSYDDIDLIDAQADGHRHVRERRLIEPVQVRESQAHGFFGVGIASLDRVALNGPVGRQPQEHLDAVRMNFVARELELDTLFHPPHVRGV